MYTRTQIMIYVQTQTHSTHNIYTFHKKKHEYHVYEDLQNTMHTKGGNQL
jgi:hypothetical protein